MHARSKWRLRCSIFGFFCRPLKWSKTFFLRCNSITSRLFDPDVRVLNVNGANLSRNQECLRCVPLEFIYTFEWLTRTCMCTFCACARMHIHFCTAITTVYIVPCIQTDTFRDVLYPPKIYNVLNENFDLEFKYRSTGVLTGWA
jgi:hypothetical protein